MASMRRNIFYKNKKQETTEIGSAICLPFYFAVFVDLYISYYIQYEYCIFEAILAHPSRSIQWELKSKLRMRVRQSHVKEVDPCSVVKWGQNERLELSSLLAGWKQSVCPEQKDDAHSNYKKKVHRSESIDNGLLSSLQSILFRKKTFLYYNFFYLFGWIGKSMATPSRGGDLRISQQFGSGWSVQGEVVEDKGYGSVTELANPFRLVRATITFATP
ncbi:hypothetical protein AAG570_003664 [Ranatra chinensis]|uniref:Uncharacterized protein n=1 Tax=Ranatra chinensis TaxID=642074 RepID=A0ABD0Y5H7_9HEMI